MGATTPTCSPRSARPSPRPRPAPPQRRPPRTRPWPNAPVRVAVDHADAPELAGKLDKLAKGLASANPAVFRLLRQQGVFLGRGPAPKLAFLYTGQGSQYVNMLKSLDEREPIVQQTFDEADRVMTPLLGRPLTSYIFVDGDDPAAVKTLEPAAHADRDHPAGRARHRHRAHPAARGIRGQPDMVMGHSLGEYGALVAAGALDLDTALEAVSARGREMTKVSVADNGAMAAVFAPMAEIQRIVDEAEGYVVIANINSTSRPSSAERPSRSSGSSRLPGRGDQRHPDPGQPRLPHLDRRPRVASLRRRRCAGSTCALRPSRSSPT